jgi:hypothetical protein
MAKTRKRMKRGRNEILTTALGTMGQEVFLSGTSK